MATAFQGSESCSDNGLIHSKAGSMHNVTDANIHFGHNHINSCEFGFSECKLSSDTINSLNDFYADIASLSSLESYRTAPDECSNPLRRSSCSFVDDELCNSYSDLIFSNSSSSSDNVEYGAGNYTICEQLLGSSQVTPLYSHMLTVANDGAVQRNKCTVRVTHTNTTDHTRDGCNDHGADDVITKNSLDLLKEEYDINSSFVNSGELFKPASSLLQYSAPIASMDSINITCNATDVSLNQSQRSNGCISTVQSDEIVACKHKDTAEHRASAVIGRRCIGDFDFDAMTTSSDSESDNDTFRRQRVTIATCTSAEGGTDCPASAERRIYAQSSLYLTSSDSCSSSEDGRHFTAGSSSETDSDDDFDFLKSGGEIVASPLSDSVDGRAGQRGGVARQSGNGGALRQTGALDRNQSRHVNRSRSLGSTPRHRKKKAASKAKLFRQSSLPSCIIPCVDCISVDTHDDIDAWYCSQRLAGRSSGGINTNHRLNSCVPDHTYMENNQIIMETAVVAGCASHEVQCNCGEFEERMELMSPHGQDAQSAQVKHCSPTDVRSCPDAALNQAFKRNVSNCERNVHDSSSQSLHLQHGNASLLKYEAPHIRSTDEIILGINSPGQLLTSGGADCILPAQFIPRDTCSLSGVGHNCGDAHSSLGEHLNTTGSSLHLSHLTVYQNTATHNTATHNTATHNTATHNTATHNTATHNSITTCPLHRRSMVEQGCDDGASPSSAPSMSAPWACAPSVCAPRAGAVPSTHSNSCTNIDNKIEPLQAPLVTASVSFKDASTEWHCSETSSDSDSDDPGVGATTGPCLNLHLPSATEIDADTSSDSSEFEDEFVENREDSSEDGMESECNARLDHDMRSECNLGAKTGHVQSPCEGDTQPDLPLLCAGVACHASSYSLSVHSQSSHEYHLSSPPRLRVHPLTGGERSGWFMDHASLTSTLSTPTSGPGPRGLSGSSNDSWSPFCHYDEPGDSSSNLSLSFEELRLVDDSPHRGAGPPDYHELFPSPNEPGASMSRSCVAYRDTAHPSVPVMSSSLDDLPPAYHEVTRMHVTPHSIGVPPPSYDQSTPMITRLTSSGGPCTTSGRRRQAITRRLRLAASAIHNLFR